MKTNLLSTLAMIIIIASTSLAQTSGDVYWHIDPRVKTCSMVVDPSLTPAEWKTFVQQVGPISAFKSLASAEPLGAMNFGVGIDMGRTPVDQHSLAWINTFTHPDADCPLGDAISFPVIRARVGVTDKMDVGAYWTTAPGANYGMAGGEIRYQISSESENLPAAMVRGSATFLTGVPDFDLGIYSAEVLASKKVAMFTPYVGLRGGLVSGALTTSQVNLSDERVFFAQGYAGVTTSLWIVNVAAEYNISYVNTFAFTLGFNF